jgi:hypothetical protein
LFVADHWKHDKKGGKIARYVEFSAVEGGRVIGANNSVGFTRVLSLTLQVAFEKGLIATLHLLSFLVRLNRRPVE